jgi:hypothetical protein
MYWDDRWLEAGVAREVGFAYGLGQLASGEGEGKLALTVGGSFTTGGQFTLTAYVRDPEPGQTLTVTLPEGFQLVEGDARQEVPPLAPQGTSRYSPVTWKIRAANQERTYDLKVKSSTGVSQRQPVMIRSKRIFD